MGVLTDIVSGDGINLTSRGNVGTVSDIVKLDGGVTEARGSIGTLVDITTPQWFGAQLQNRGNIGTLVDSVKDTFVMLTEAFVASLARSFGIIIG